jgi:hypothetical protein
MTQAQLTRHEHHRDIAEQLLATSHEGYPGLATETFLKALAHGVLALAYAKADTRG